MMTTSHDHTGHWRHPWGENESVSDPVVAEFEFDTGVVVRVTTVNRALDPAAVLAALGVASGRPALVLCGGAASLDTDIATRAALAPVLGPAVLTAAAHTSAAIIDGGTDAGVVALLGQAASTWDGSAPMLGVAPAALVADPAGATTDEGAVRLEPHHPFFVLTPGEAWGDETPWLTALAAAAAGSEPVVMVLAGGGTVAVAEVSEAVRRGWPVVLLEDTGGLARELAMRWRQAHLPDRRSWLARLLSRRAEPPSLPPELSAVSEDELLRLVIVGRFRLVPSRTATELAQALAWEMQHRPVLADAWERFARYDQAAVGLRRSFERSQLVILALGLAATLLALLLRALDTPLHGSATWVATSMHWMVVALPLLAGALIAFADRFAFGKRWVLLRGAAETIKSEIYCYRTGTGIYAESAAATPSPEQLMAVRLAAVDSRLFDTEVSAADLPAYTGVLPPPESWIAATDDGFSHLSADRYMSVRACDQIRFYQARTERHGRKLQYIQATILLAAAAGGFVAAVGQEIWVGLTTALATAFAAHRSYLQLDATMVAYNQAASRLKNLLTYWEARPAAERASEFGWLVEQTEAVLQTELGGWVQQMNEALHTLQRQQAAQQREAETAASQTGQPSHSGPADQPSTARAERPLPSGIGQEPAEAHSAGVHTTQSGAVSSPGNQAASPDHAGGEPPDQI